MPTGCSSYKFTMYRDWYTRVVAKLCPAKGKKGWPQLDVFGSRGARVVEREDGKPARLVKDPYNMSWTRQFLWILAPWEHIDRVLYKLAEDMARAIVVVPSWVHRKWWQPLMTMCTATYTLTWDSLYAFDDAGNSVSLQADHRFKLVACLVDRSLLGAGCIPSPFPEATVDVCSVADTPSPLLDYTCLDGGWATRIEPCDLGTRVYDASNRFLDFPHKYSSVQEFIQDRNPTIPVHQISFRTATGHEPENSQPPSSLQQPESIEAILRDVKVHSGHEPPPTPEPPPQICHCIRRVCVCSVGQGEWAFAAVHQPYRVQQHLILPWLEPTSQLWRGHRGRLDQRHQRVRSLRHDPVTGANTLGRSSEVEPCLCIDDCKCVRSVIHTSDEVNDSAAQIWRDVVQQQFGADVLAGEVPPIEDDIVRGPLGYARVNLKSNAAPRRQRPFPHLGERGEALSAIIERNLHKRGWLEHASSGSDWSSPLFCVPKAVPPGTPLLDKWRLVIDYRYLNENTRDDQAPLPLIEDILERHQAHKPFTVLDLKHGFHQMPLLPEQRYLTAIPTPLGTLQWRVLPMGVKNEPGQFQRMMDWVPNHRRGKQDRNGVWQGIPDPIRCATIYIDDLIIGTGGPEDGLYERHHQDVCRVLERLQDWFLVCGLNKNKMFVRPVEFCGQILSAATRKPAPASMLALEKWPKPVTVSQLRSFLGVCNYYHIYIPQYATLAAPLQELLKGDRAAKRKESTVKLQWTDVHTSHFEALKRAVIGIKELMLYRPDADFFMRCDASLYGVGCVLEQRDEEGNSFPIAFFSRRLTPGQRKWSLREKETYAIVSALRKYATWISNNRVTILIDHQAMEGWHREHVETPSSPSGRRGRWHETFSRFRLEVVYLPARDNAMADVMSRWVYPACQLDNDVCKHGSLADKLAVEELERLEHAEEQQCIHAVGCLDLRQPEQLRQFLHHLPPNDKLGCKDCGGTLNFPDSHHCNECYLIQVVSK